MYLRIICVVAVIIFLGGCAQKGELFNKYVSFEPGSYKIGEETVQCGHAQTIVTPYLKDYAASKPGSIYINPQRTHVLPVYAQRFIYAHECAHELQRASEPEADCIAAEKGKEQGWLDKNKIDKICQNILLNLPATRVHLSGLQRCEHIHSCYAQAI